MRSAVQGLFLSELRHFRPVLMTSLAAMSGMLPLVLTICSGAELLQRLANSVIGGLAVVLLLSLIITPTVRSILQYREK